MTTKDDNTKGENAYLFHHLVAMFQALAMQQMGKIMNPVTGKVERDLQQARITIDMIDMIQTKTAGNLTGDEKKLIDAILMDLRMNYVDETSRPQEDDAVGDEEKEAEETAGEGEGKDSGDQDVPESEENESDKSG